MLRIVPFILVCYFFGYLDRVNVGFAKLGMVHDLSLSEAAYGLGAGLFFIGYLLLQVPAGYLVQLRGPRKCIAGSMIAWGLVSVATLLTRDEASFYALRFLLGVTEAAFFPAVIACFSLWFPSYRLSKVMSLLFLALPLGVIVGGPMSGWIMDATHGGYGLKGWQWMFLLEGLPAILLGLFATKAIVERPDGVDWLTPGEKALVLRELTQESRDKQTSLLPALCEPTLWILFATTFLYNLGNYGLVFWMPSMIKSIGGLTNFQIGVVTALPYFVAACAMLINSFHSVKTGERLWHTALPLIAGGVALVASVTMRDVPALSLLCLTVGISGIQCTLAMFWSLPSRVLAGTAAASGAGLVNIGAAIAGFAGPTILGLLGQLTGSNTAGVSLLAIGLFAAAGLIFAIPRRLMARPVVSA
ncbi:MFS transporter [Bradyrhizobium sp. BR 10261]|uniref:MFS transporter n=1 Tax=Bradyrhizobium sp. BR 10261 TaxID=2749992 RepID=UPI001C653569|nr:MFS transporter [Bradyrhizobium sp. BR 10261]